jgi:hypothetical protein
MGDLSRIRVKDTCPLFPAVLLVSPMASWPVESKSACAQKVGTMCQVLSLEVVANIHLKGILAGGLLGTLNLSILSCM